MLLIKNYFFSGFKHQNTFEDAALAAVDAADIVKLTADEARYPAQPWGAEFELDWADVALDEFWAGLAA